MCELFKRPAVIHCPLNIVGACVLSILISPSMDCYCFAGACVLSILISPCMGLSILISPCVALILFCPSVCVK